MRASDKKLDQSQRLQNFLFSYRNTVRRSTNRTPSQLMFGRHLRSRLDLLKPDVMKNIEHEQFIQKAHHDSTAAQPRMFSESEKVWVNNPLGKGSLPGQIVKQTGPLSYVVEIDGVLRRKHSDQLRTRRSNTPTKRQENVSGNPELRLHSKIRDEAVTDQHSEIADRPSVSNASEDGHASDDVETDEDRQLTNEEQTRNIEITMPRRNPPRVRKVPSRFMD